MLVTFVLLYNTKNIKIMEKKIIINEQNVFSFDGKKLIPLGQACVMEDIWQGKIFTIENNLYAKKGDEFSLLVEDFYDVYVVEIGEPAQKQFELVHDVLVMVEKGVAGLRKLAKAYAPYLDAKLSWKEKPILFVEREKEDKVFVVIEDENGNIRLSDQKAVFIDKDSNFFCWNYRIYNFSFDSVEFYLTSLHLLFAGNNYLVFRNDYDENDNEHSAAIAISKDGKLTPLGLEPEIVELPNATVIKSSEGVYHLKKDELCCVTNACYSDNSFFIHDDGTVVHTYTIEQSDAPDIPREDTYRLVNGNYKLVKRKDQ